MAEENKHGMTDAQSKLESSKTHARKAAENLRDAAGAMAGEYRGKAEQAWGDARGKAEQAWDDATTRVRTFQEDAEQYVRENPTKAVKSFALAMVSPLMVWPRPSSWPLNGGGEFPKGLVPPAISPRV